MINKEVKIGEYYQYGTSLVIIYKVDDMFYWYKNCSMKFTSRLPINIWHKNMLTGYIKYSPKNTPLYKAINS